MMEEKRNNKYAARNIGTLGASRQQKTSFKKVSSKTDNSFCYRYQMVSYSRLDNTATTCL